MTDEEKKPKEKPVAKKSTEVSKKSEKTKNTPQNKGSGVGWLALIIAVFAIAAGFYGFTELKKQIALSTSSAAGIEENTANALNQFEIKTEGLIKENAVNLSSQLQLANEKINLLEKQIGKNKRQWLIAEAEYLASVANTRLLLAGDVETAIIALQTADQKLRENGAPMTYAVRKQIAKEISLLKSAELPDIVGISSQLLALESTVAKMDISEPHAGTAQSPSIGKGDTSPIPENIQETLNEAWENFSKLIVVRRHDRPTSALMTPEQVELIRKNLALKLEAARLALIKQHETLYKASITISIEWLNDYFDANNASVSAAIEQLKQLRNATIKAALPSIHLSLKMIQELPILAIEEQKAATEAASETAETVPEIKTEQATETDSNSKEEPANDSVKEPVKQAN